MPDARASLFDTTIPRFYVDGREKTELARDVQAVEVEEDTAGMKRLRLDLGAVGPQRGARDEQLLYLDGAVIDFGSKLAVSMGPRESARTVFTGHVSAIELALAQGREPELRVFAEDRLMDLRMTRRFKTYEEVSDADLVQAIAGEHGLSGQADVDGPSYPSIQQWNQSDLAFLRTRAERLHADVWLDGDTLHMASRERHDAGALTLIQGNDLVAVELRADLAHQRSSVRIGGFDELAKEAIDEEAGADAIAGEAAGGRHGIDVLTRAFGERASYRVRDVPLDSDDARQWARAELLRRARRFVAVRGVTLGTPALVVGNRVTLERVGALFEGQGYYVTRVAHAFDTRAGYRTHFDAERAWIASP